MLVDKLIQLRDELDGGNINPGQFIQQVNILLLEVKTLSMDEKAERFDKMVNLIFELHQLEKLNARNEAILDEDTKQWIYEGVLQIVFGKDWFQFSNRTYVHM